jgi:hypothetical protein
MIVLIALAEQGHILRDGVAREIEALRAELRDNIGLGVCDQLIADGVAEDGLRSRQESRLVQLVAQPSAHPAEQSRQELAV